MARKYVKPDLDLPFYLYQIQTKFRDEPRAKSGLLRGREFLMKYLYSFHTDEADMLKYYEVMKGVYRKVFGRLGLEAIIKRRVYPKVEKWAHTIGFALLLALILLVTYNDILKLVR